MKDKIELLLIILAFLTIFFPWLFGTIDFIWYFFNDTQITHIHWDFWKIVFAILWPFIAIGICEQMYPSF